MTTQHLTQIVNESKTDNGTIDEQLLLEKLSMFLVEHDQVRQSAVETYKVDEKGELVPGQYFFTCSPDGTMTWPPQLTPWLDKRWFAGQRSILMRKIENELLHKHEPLFWGDLTDKDKERIYAWRSEIIANFCKDKLVVADFECGEHGKVTPELECPKCRTSRGAQ